MIATRHPILKTAVGVALGIFLAATVAIGAYVGLIVYVSYQSVEHQQPFTSVR